jgi:hypothetical protein
MLAVTAVQDLMHQHFEAKPEEPRAMQAVAAVAAHLVALVALAAEALEATQEPSTLVAVGVATPPQVAPCMQAAQESSS